jgi:hypothetical protein
MQAMRVRVVVLATWLAALTAGTAWGQNWPLGHNPGYFTPAGTFSHMGDGNPGLAQAWAQGYFGEIFPVLTQNGGAYGVTLPSIGGLPYMGTPGYGALVPQQPALHSYPASVPQSPQPMRSYAPEDHVRRNLAEPTRQIAYGVTTSEAEASRQFWAGYWLYWSNNTALEQAR